jgi:hypothetical protein
MKCGMYKVDCCLMPMEVHEPHSYANAATTLDLWHRRLGHVKKPDVQRLVQGDAVTGMGDVSLPKEFDKCGVCLKAKQAKASFPRSVSHVNVPLKIVHSDLIGTLASSWIPFQGKICADADG